MIMNILNFNKIIPYFDLDNNYTIFWINAQKVKLSFKQRSTWATIATCIIGEYPVKFPYLIKRFEQEKIPRRSIEPKT